jgi:hypothetical protein
LLLAAEGKRATEDHRPEAGGFESRLKARLLLDTEKTGDLNSLATSTSTEFVSPCHRPSPVRLIETGRLEGEGF